MPLSCRPASSHSHHSLHSCAHSPAGLSYLDKSKDPSNPEKKVEEREAFGFDSYVDSVFLGAPEHLELDVGTGAAVAIDASGWEDAVVWNPHHTMKECYEVRVGLVCCLGCVVWQGSGSSRWLCF